MGTFRRFPTTTWFRRRCLKGNYTSIISIIFPSLTLEILEIENRILIVEPKDKSQSFEENEIKYLASIGANMAIPFSPLDYEGDEYSRAIFY